MLFGLDTQEEAKTEERSQQSHRKVKKKKEKVSNSQSSWQRQLAEASNLGILTFEPNGRQTLDS